MKTFIQLVCTLIITTAFFCLGNKVYGVGASVPFTDSEAEAGTLGGGASLVSMVFPQTNNPENLQEASGAAYVTLTGTGQSVSWVNNSGQNITAINFRIQIPDAPAGGGTTNTIDLYVNGTLRQAITVSSTQVYIYGTPGVNDQNPADGDGRRMWDEFHLFISGAAIASGSTIMLKKDSGNTASFYNIDLIDLEVPPAPLTQPANSLSIMSYGAVSNSPSTDNTSVIQSCINDAKSQGKSVWIPVGTFYTGKSSTSGLTVPSGVTVNGAGEWYSTLYSNPKNPSSGGNMIAVNGATLQNFTLDCNSTYKGCASAMNMSGTNWFVNSIWVHHTSLAVWGAGVNGTIGNIRVNNTWSDGLNLNNFSGSSNIGTNLKATNNFIRFTGDDGLAINGTDSSGHTPMNGVLVADNTLVETGGRLVVYGGNNVTITNNYTHDVILNDGIQIGYEQQTANISNVLAQGNLSLRCGNAAYGGEPETLIGSQNTTYSDNGTNKSYSDSHITFIGNTINDAYFSGLQLQICTNVVVENNTINSPGLSGIDIISYAFGSALIATNFVSDVASGQSAYTDHSTAGFLATVVNNSWQTVSQGDATADSSDDGVNVPGNGNDGNLSTRWAASTGTYPQWWAVDLGDKYILQSATIDWYNAASRYYQYDIQVSSDGVNYTTVVNKTGNTTMGNTTDTFSATNRYVRVYVTGASAGYASFYECQLFGNPVPGVLLSQGEPTTASSDDGVNFSSNANDGNTTSTRWAASTGSFPQTWTVNLGSSHTLKSVTTDWYNASSRYYQYQIQVSSDDVHFTTVVDKSGNTTDGNTTDTFSATGQYVRINVTGSSTGYASFYECQVFGN